MYISPINLLRKKPEALEKFEQATTEQMHEIGNTIENYNFNDEMDLLALEQTFTERMREIGNTIEKNISDQCIQAAYEFGIGINKEELIAALKADRERYEQAYQQGYRAGKCDALRDLDSYKNTGMWEVPDND